MGQSVATTTVLSIKKAYFKEKTAASQGSGAKDFLRRQFDDWYTHQVTQQLKEKNDEIEDCDLQPLDLSMTHMKEFSAHWLVLAADYISQNPSLLVNGFMKAGITEGIDDVECDDEDKQDEEETITIDSSDEYVN
uniref:Uncharacterized protein n=1 Tax=Amphimedon queenslandica TaxID=400682 RepID=A0A1X7UCF7_AMPQE